MSDKIQRVPVEVLVDGDIVDLEGDSYADPNSDNPIFPFEYARVDGPGEQETPECYRLDTDAGSFGFPTGHLIRLMAELTERIPD